MSGGGGLIQKSRGEAKPFLFVLAAVAALGGFLFGYDTGVISGALLFIKPAFHASTFQQQAIIGSLLVGAVVGAAASGYLAEAMSRKWTKVLSGCIYVAAALWSAFASGASELIAALCLDSRLERRRLWRRCTSRRSHLERSAAGWCRSTR